jgi:hypothetical protein
MSEQQNNEIEKPKRLGDVAREMKTLLGVPAVRPAIAAGTRKKNGLFIIEPANWWQEQAKNCPVPRPLFKELWHEGEVCILFADTNTGKSILAVQIGEEISAEQLVLYFDFELTKKQFENRYSNGYDHHYIFRENLHRVEIDPDAEVPDGMLFEEFLNECMEWAVEDTGAKILIIDNLTYLRQETERAREALPLMKQLKALKNKYGLSILCLAHTPKRDTTKPITRNDLQGSKMLINFCDSAFSIGESASDNTLRYIKQIKARNTEVIYDSKNVIIARITKPDNFLCFEFMGCGPERDHLKQISDEERDEMKTKVHELHQQGRSTREIGRELGIHYATASRIIKRE